VRLQRLGADPMARERARAAALARTEEESRRRQATADEENRRRQETAARTEQARLAAEQERLRREQAEAAERERREAPERERRAREERERLAKEEADRQARLAREEADRQARLAKEEADRQARIAVEQARVAREYEIRVKADREAAERRAREWRARQAAFALRWQLLAGLQRQGADPLHRQHLEEARVAARMEEQRRQYEARARRELDVVVARRAAIDLRFGLLARLQTMGADPDFRRKRDETMFRDMDAEARRLETARVEASERVRWETQAAIDLRVLTKLRLRQLGAVDRPTCPPRRSETPPPAPFAGATWIQGATTGTASPGSGRPATTNARPKRARSGSRPRRSRSAARWSSARPLGPHLGRAATADPKALIHLPLPLAGEGRGERDRLKQRARTPPRTLSRFAGRGDLTEVSAWAGGSGRRGCARCAGWSRRRAGCRRRPGRRRS
jgi:hypothetical protein